MDPRIDVRIRKAAGDRRVIGLGGGLPAAAQFPKKQLAAAFLGALAEPGTPALQYGWPEGSPALREWIAAGLRARGADVAAEDVIVTNGAQQAIDLALRLVVKRGGRITTDAETYPAALDLFRARKVQATTERARAVYAMPSMSNPRGRRMSDAERSRLLGRHDWIIEDDAYAELRFAGAPPSSLLSAAPERVLHVGTLSKTLSPGMRVGWLVPPRHLVQRAIRFKHATDLQPSTLAQSIVERYLDATDWPARLDALRKFYQRRARRLERVLRAALPGWQFDSPEGGFALWVAPDREIEELKLLDCAIARGVSFDPGSEFRPDRAPRPLALRLAFSAVSDDDELDEGVRRLALAWRDATRGP